MIDRLSILWHYLAAQWRFTRWRDHASLTTWQETQVQRHLANVSRKSPYFAELAERCGIAQWRQWPLTDKREMMQHFDRWNTAGISLKEAWEIALRAERTRDFTQKCRGITVGMSSGTSSSRGVFLVSDAERHLWAGTLLSRVLQGTLFHQHRAVLFLRADSPLYQTMGSSRFQFAFYDLFQPLQELWPQLLNFSPTILAAPPSVLTYLSTQQGAAYLLKKPRILLSVADVLDEQDRQRIESGFAAPVGQIYQATEGFLAATCPQGRLHWNEDAVVIQKEWLDDAKTRYTPIITDFRRFTQPIVRYRLDDVIVQGDTTPCPCGSVFETLEAVEGRCDDRLILPSVGQEATVTVFPDFVRRAMMLALPDGVDYTVSQRSSLHWDISLSQADTDAWEGIVREIRLLCQQLGAQAPQLTLAPWTAPAHHAKRRRVRCELPTTSPP